MLARRIHLLHFRNHGQLELDFAAGPNTIVGRNGRGKTNIIEAINYFATLGSHRVASDTPLIQHGFDAAHAEGQFVRAGRTATLAIDIVPGKANKVMFNDALLPRPRDVLGIVQSVIFAPEDLDLVKGDPGVRRKYLDDFAVAMAPRVAGVRADFERVLKQRTSLLKSAGRRALSTETRQSLEAWNEQFVRHAAALVVERLVALDRLGPWISEHGDTMSGANEPLAATYSAAWLDPAVREVDTVTEQLRVALQQREREELDRGQSLVGPHRDDVTLMLSGAPAKGYASHGQSWSIALAMRLATFSVLRELDDDPILLLDDVFAELDERRRSRLLDAIRGVEQTIVTAAVQADVPSDMLSRVHELAD